MLSAALALALFGLGMRRPARWALGFAVAFTEKWRESRLASRVSRLLAEAGRNA